MRYGKRMRKVLVMVLSFVILVTGMADDVVWKAAAAGGSFNYTDGDATYYCDTSTKTCELTKYSRNVAEGVEDVFEIPGTVTADGVDYAVTSIGSSAFYKCNSLTSITIPDSVTSIGSSAFSRCSGLTSIEIPDGVKYINSSTFENCSSLTGIGIPDSVTYIDSSAFSGCSGLTSIAIPNSVTSIGSSAFSGCSGLTSIGIPDGVKYINSSTFENCSSLTSIEIPDGVTSIGFYAFGECSSLTGIAIPDSVTSINAAFEGCSSNLTIYCVEGSNAESFAKSHRITYVLMDVPMIPVPSTGASIATPAVTETPTIEATSQPTATAKPTATPKPLEDQDQAFLMFTDGSWSWGNWNTRISGGFGKDAAITGDGSYEVSINADDYLDSLKAAAEENGEKATAEIGGAEGAMVLCVDFMGLCNSPNLDVSQMKVSNIKVYADNKTVSVNTDKILMGDIDGAGNFRIEIANQFGDTKKDAAIDRDALTFTSSLKVSFTLSGIKEGSSGGAFSCDTDGDGESDTYTKAADAMDEWSEAGMPDLKPIYTIVNPKPTPTPSQPSRSAVPEVTDTETRAYTAIVGFQTNTYDYRMLADKSNSSQYNASMGKSAEALYDEWLTEQGQDVSGYRNASIYLNGNGPVLTKSGRLRTPEKVELFRGATATDVKMSEDSEYTVSISGLDFGVTADAEKIFNMLYVDTDIPVDDANANTKLTASSVKLNGKEFAKDVVLPNKGDVKLNHMFMVADVYAPGDKTENCPYYGNQDDADKKLLNVPEGTFDIEISFKIEGADWASAPLPEVTSTPTPSQPAMPEITPPPIVNIVPFDIYIASNVNSALTPDEGEKGADGKSIQTAVFASKEIKAKIDDAKSKEGKPLFTEGTMLWHETGPNTSSKTISQTGEYELSVTARGDSEDLTNDGAIWFPLLINGTDSNMPADFKLLGKSITVGEGDAARTYNWPTRLLQDNAGSVRLTVCNQWETGALKEISNAVKDVIPVKKGDKLSFKFYVIPEKPAPAPTPTPAAISTAPAISYNAYLGFQTDTFVFRGTFNDNTYGLNSKDIDYKNEIGYWDGAAADTTKPAKLKVAITDAIMMSNGTRYTVSIKGLNLQTLKGSGKNDSVATAFNMLYISTNIPLATKGVLMVNAVLKIDGVEVKKYEVVPCKGDAVGYYQFMLADGYAPADGTKDASYRSGDLLRILPADSIEVSYTIYGANFLQFPGETENPTPGNSGSNSQGGAISNPTIKPTPSKDDGLEDEDALSDLAVEGLDIATGNTVKKGFLTVPRVQLSWDANSKCDGYEIWRREGTGSFKKVDVADDADETEWYDTSVEKGKRYSYKVLGYVEDDNGKTLRAEEADVVSAAIRKTVKTCTYTAKRTGRNLKITFKRAEGTKCQIQVRYAGRGKWKNVTCALNKKIVKKVSPKRLKIRIRTCEKVGGRMKYSRWTREKTVR